MGQNFSSLDAAMTSAVAVASALSQLAEQDQDQEDNDHESEPAAPVVAGSIEGTVPIPLKPPSRMMIKTMSRIVPIDMERSP
jgi:hypothetical protein